MNSYLLVTILILISLTWAGSFIVVDIVSDSMSPIDLGFLRFVVATPILGVLVLLQKKSLAIPIKVLPYLLLLALTGVTFLYLFQFIGIALTNASTGSILINTNVLFIALFSAFLFGEHFTWRKTVGVLLSFSGVVLILFSYQQPFVGSISLSFILGGLLVVASAVCWAVFSLVGKQVVQQYDEQIILFYVFLLGTFFYLPFVLPQILHTVFEIDILGWSGVFYLALACSIFAYFGWYYCLKHVEASKAAVFLTLIPLFTILMDLFRGIQPSWVFLLGAGVILAGVHLTQQAQTRESN